MKVIVVGCGQIGSALAYQLYKMGHQVTVIDRDSSAFDNLSVDFQGRSIEGDVLSRDVLHRAEIEGTSALAAVTRSDSLNVVVAHIARSEFQVSKVVARNYDPRQRQLQEAFGVPVIGSANWGVQRIIGMLSEAPLRPIYLDNKVNFVIYRLEVPEDWHGHPLLELISENQSRPLAWIRAGRLLEVSHSQSLETGDLIYWSADSDEIETLRLRLGFQKE